jgi:hypothetical protein
MLHPPKRPTQNVHLQNVSRYRMVNPTKVQSTKHPQVKNAFAKKRSTTPFFHRILKNVVLHVKGFVQRELRWVEISINRQVLL